MEKNTHRLGSISLYWLLAAILLIGLYLTRLSSYLLFHSLAELFSVVIAGAIFIIAWNSRRFLDHSYFLFLGIAYLFVGGIDLLHTLAYKGMGVFPASDANLPTQLWIAGRYLQSISLLAAPLFLKRKAKPGWILLIYVLVTAVLLLSIFAWKIFPTSYVQGLGQTPFKVISEYVIIGIFGLSIAVLYRVRQALDPGLLRWLVLSVLVSMVSELAFTFYFGVYDAANLLGHYLKIIAYWFIYKSIIETGLNRPYELLFRDLLQRENALEVTNRRLQAVLKALPLAVEIAGQDGRITEANQMREAVWGEKAVSSETTGDEHGQGWWSDSGEQVGKDDWPLARALKGETSLGKQIRIRRHDGSEATLLIGAAPIVDSKGSFLGAVNVAQDITEREMLLLENQVQRDLLERLVQNAPVGIAFLQGPEHSYTLVNAAYRRIARGKGELIGKPLASVWPEIAGEIVPLLESVYQTGESFSAVDMPYHIQRGNILEENYFTYTFSPLFNKRMQIEGIMILALETTEQVLNQRQIEAEQADLRRYAQQLEQSNRELDQFASIASHDLQEPLRKIQMFSERVQKRAGDNPGSLGEQEQDYLDRMTRAAKRMQDMIESLLMFSRVTTKAQPFVPVDLQQVTKEVVSDLEARIYRSGGRVELGELPTIEADAVQMYQLMQNLIANALKFNREGVPPVVQVSGKVIENGDPFGKRLLVRVTDNGVGFDMNEIERIFRPFERLHGLNEYEGTGMGLAICAKIVERHMGTITAESLPGKGSTFIINLPVCQDSPKVDLP